jgi:DNA polymerase
MTKSELLNNLYDKYRSVFPDKEIVVGAGNHDAIILLVGEAPGKDEVKLSKPFVGAAGKNLNELLQITGLERDGVYITNAIKYRLSKLSEKSGRIANRPAREDEIRGNREYLMEEIKIIRPKIVVTLGNVPLKAICCRSISIGDVHGKVMTSGSEELGCSLFPLYHPASIIYNRSLKDIYNNDMLELKSLIHNMSK